MARGTFVVNPANAILDSTMAKTDATEAFVDGQIASAVAAYDLLLDGSKTLVGQSGDLTPEAPSWELPILDTALRRLSTQEV